MQRTNLLERMAEESEMSSARRPKCGIDCLPPEVLQIVLSHLIRADDYLAWIRIASISRSFARCLELYIPFDTVEVLYGMQSRALISRTPN